MNEIAYLDGGGAIIRYLLRFFDFCRRHQYRQHVNSVI